MNGLSRRIDKIEERLGSSHGPVRRWPNGDGTFIEFPAGLTLVDICALVRSMEHSTDEADRRLDGNGGHYADEI